MARKPNNRLNNASEQRGGQWGQILNPIFSHSTLLIPRRGQEDIDRVTFAPAAQIRQAATTWHNLELYRPSKNPTNVLQRIGFDDLRELNNFPAPVSNKGIFVPLESLGMSVAFSIRETDMDAARNELEDEYEFVPDFPLSIPCRVILRDTPSNKSRSKPLPDTQRWPAESGIVQAHELGIRGAGALVGVLDTGVDADHQEFADHRINYRFVSLQPNSPYWPPRDVRGFDVDGHGTHVCGIIAGKSIGVAPEVQLYVASVIESETTMTSLTRVAAGLNWLFRQFTRPDNENLPAVLSMSLGFPKTLPGVPSDEYEKRLNVLRKLLQTLMQANVLPIVAIGNDGEGQFGYPGAFKEVLGVGAVEFTGEVAEFSGSGQPSGEGVLKPDVVGYGVGVYSCLERDYSGNAVYQRLNGTSMATPYVAGIAALYRSLYPALTLEEIKSMLLANALPLSSQPRHRIGSGLARFQPKREERRRARRQKAS
jgi:Subtilase family